MIKYHSLIFMQMRSSEYHYLLNLLDYYFVCVHMCSSCEYFVAWRMEYTCSEIKIWMSQVCRHEGIMQSSKSRKNRHGGLKWHYASVSSLPHSVIYQITVSVGYVIRIYIITPWNASISTIISVYFIRAFMPNQDLPSLNIYFTLSLMHPDSPAIHCLST